ncbi:hypothetical protein CLV98_10553 [Dyadobacter jejuensis]|uniref:Uncharacterized protein n=1 Tax=Dyadobacter jejuensis TaxID=1082580 RepID=A0A316AJE3_9BACT|nr:DUF6252 family protein [Dyadobacter jejuensis]PWJ57873.1 hypothetical protein CLV98_10553 [Dyadobacter jejuensis]
MKNQKNTSLYVITIVLWLTTISCDKGPHLTPITQEGKNTFSCKVNGKVWVPTGKIEFFATLKPINGGFFINSITEKKAIWIRTYTSNEERMDIYLKDINLQKHLLFKNTTPVEVSLNPENYCLYQNSEMIKYITSSLNTGYVSLTQVDTLSGIIAGTFEFTAADTKGNLVRITDGRFDVKSPL